MKTEREGQSERERERERAERERRVAVCVCVRVASRRAVHKVLKACQLYMSVEGMHSGPQSVRVSWRARAHPHTHINIREAVLST